jgi:hypothetical protein
MNKPNFELAAAHQFFSAECFNRAWDEMDKTNRTQEEDEQMLLLGHASLWHWSQRADCTPTTLSVGCWQLARIYALLNQATLANIWAQRSLEYSQSEGVAPFYRAYACEALARSWKIGGDSQKMQEFLKLAQEWASRITEEEDRKLILDDLAGLA